MTADWCSQVLQEALASYPNPTIFNTDQGSQFTADVFTALLLKANVQMAPATRLNGWQRTCVGQHFCGTAFGRSAGAER